MATLEVTRPCMRCPKGSPPQRYGVCSRHYEQAKQEGARDHEGWDSGDYSLFEMASAHGRGLQSSRH